MTNKTAMTYPSMIIECPTCGGKAHLSLYSSIQTAVYRCSSCRTYFERPNQDGDTEPVCDCVRTIARLRVDLADAKQRLIDREANVIDKITEANMEIDHARKQRQEQDAVMADLLPQLDKVIAMLRRAGNKDGEAAR